MEELWKIDGSVVEGLIEYENDVLCSRRAAPGQVDSWWWSLQFFSIKSPDQCVPKFLAGSRALSFLY